MADIFLSYARENVDQARMLAHLLAEFGWTVFWDHEILAGSIFDDVIQRELDDAKCVVCLWSIRSVSSQWVRSEAEEGANRNMLVSLLIDDIRLPIAFRRIQAARLLNWDGSKEDEQLKDVLKAIRFVIEKPPQGRSDGSARPEADPFVRRAATSPTAGRTHNPVGESGFSASAEGKQRRMPAKYLSSTLAIIVVAAGIYLALAPRSPSKVPQSVQTNVNTKQGERTNILSEEIESGKPFVVMLDSLSEHIGTIKGGEYRVQYIPEQKVWTASGLDYESGSPKTSSDPCDTAKNSFCIWGALFRFDESGLVFFAAGGTDPAAQARQQGRQVGRIVR